MNLYLTLTLALVVTIVLTFGVFAWDKRSSVAGGARLPESFMLQLAALGGWPAAKLAQRRLRHKTRKQPFAAQLNAIVVVHVLLVCGGSLLLLSQVPA
ncbi:MAG: DUF1294 domain-containing protein [Silicimonas sp.]